MSGGGPNNGRDNMDDQASTAGLTEDLSRRLLAHFVAPGYSPPMLPAVAVELHGLAHRRDTDAAQISAVLERDPLLAARVLKISQSAAFGGAGTITSLREAVARLGMRNLSDIAWEVAFDTRVFRSVKYGALMESIQRHSTACAHLSRLTCSVTKIASEYAFLCGLLHDVGMAAALIAFSESQALGAPPESLLGPVLHACHAEASGTVARLWKLPEDVQTVIGRHHGGAPDEPISPLTSILIVADGLAGELGAGIKWFNSDLDATDPVVFDTAKQALGLDDAKMSALRTEAQKLPVFGRGTPAPATRPAPPPLARTGSASAQRPVAKSLFATRKR
ncbi:MAG TPA: HDOD domain-containing protein [Polyangia bacterium]